MNSNEAVENFRSGNINISSFVHYWSISEDMIDCVDLSYKNVPVHRINESFYYFEAIKPTCEVAGPISPMSFAR
jgi:hypothetical protein